MRTVLEFFGLVFFALLGLVLVAGFMTLSGNAPLEVRVDGTPLSLPAGFPTGLPEWLQNPTVVATLPGSQIEIERTNPLEGQPLPELFPTPTLEPTPQPPLDPVVYRTEVTLRAKNFATALEAFFAANDRMAQNPILLDDPAWREELHVLLGEISTTAHSLAEVDPAPVEYDAIDAWLKRVAPEAEGLRLAYLEGLDSRAAEDFTTAGDHFNRIKEYLGEALIEMANAGWPLE
jgi:hypothetical protein